MELLTICTRVLNSYCFGISHPVKSTHDVSRVNKIQSHARLKATPDALRYELAEWGVQAEECVCLVYTSGINHDIGRSQSRSFLSHVAVR